MVEKLIQIFGPIRLAMFGTFLMIALAFGGLMASVWVADSFKHGDYGPTIIVTSGLFALAYALMRIRRWTANRPREVNRR